MSFILDALKKSEADRQQQTGAALSGVPTATRSGGASRGLLLVTGALAGTVIVLLIVVLKMQSSDRRPQPRAAVETTVQAPVEAAPMTSSAPPVSKPTRSVDPVVDKAAANPAVSAAAQPMGSTESPAEAASPTASSEEPTTVVETAASVAAVTAAEAAYSAPPDDAETYLTFNDLRATGKLGLPDMHIDLHVYSDKPAERFVFINMNQYRENATLTEGPRLRQIRADGVLLEYIGTTFLLPRE